MHAGLYVSSKSGSSTANFYISFFMSALTLPGYRLQNVLRYEFGSIVSTFGHSVYLSPGESMEGGRSGISSRRMSTFGCAHCRTDLKNSTRVKGL